MNNRQAIRILIAEDDYLVGRSTAALLRNMGYVVVGQALNGREAVEMTQSLQPNVVLMDVKMPIMDGIEATQRIYETCPTPVVALTAYDTPEVAEPAIAAGMGAYLTKPASVREIERAINVTIARFDDMMKLRRLNAELQAEIAERKLAEEALRESEEKYRTILENIEDGYYEVDLSGNFTFFNDSLREFLGYPEDELMGMNNRGYMDEENARKVYQTFNAVYRTGKSAEVFDWEVIRKDGRRRFVEASVSLMRDSTDKPVGFRGVVRDVTDRRRAEEEIRRRNQELAALNAITATMMQSALNLKEVLQLTADGVVKGLGCNTGLIFLLDEKEGIFRGGAVSTRAGILERLNAIIGFSPLQIKIPARSDFNEAMGNLLAGRTTIKRSLHDLVGPLLSKPVCLSMQRLLDSRSFFSIPLLAKGKTIGGIVASTPQELSEADVAKLMTFANQAAIAIENARLYEETQQRALEQGTLREAALALTTALDRNEVIDRILAQLQQVVPYDSASVQLLRENHMEILGGRGFPNLPDLLGITFPADGDNPNSEVIRTRASFIVDDAPAVYEVFKKGPHQQISIRSWLGVPMLIGEQLVGMIALDKREPGFYAQGHARLAEAFAAQAAIAIENARLYEETQQRVAELDALRRTSLQLTSSLDLADVLDSIAENALSLVGATNCHLYLYDETSATFTFGAALWKNGRRDAAVKAPRRDGLTAIVAQEGQTLVINDATQHHLYTSPEARKWGVQAIAAFPLKRAERVVGVFSIAFLTPHTFSKEELRALGLLADQAAIAIENARLHTETQRRLQEQTVLREAGAAISSALDPDTVLTRIAEQMSRAIDATSAYICSYEPEKMAYMVLAEYIGPQACARERVSDLGTTYQEEDIELIETLQSGHYYIDHIDDPDLTESERVHMQQYGAQTILYISLWIKGQFRGYAELWESRRRREFTSEEITLCQDIAQQAAVAMENARLFSEAQQRAKELSTMLEAARAVSSTLDLEEVLALIAEQMAKAIGVAGCALSRWDREANAVVTLAEWRQPWTDWGDEPGTSYSLDDFPVTRAVLEKRQPITILATDPDAEPTEVALMQEAGVLSLLMLPLAVGERVIGLVELDETEREREFTDVEIHLCQALADQVAVAIENARLFEEEKRRSTQLALISEVGQKAVSVLDPGRLMLEVTRSIQESFNYYNVALFLLDNERREVVIQAVAGGFEHIIRGQYRQSLDEGIIGFVARTGKSWLASDVSKDPYYVKGFLGEALSGSELCVPIKLGDDVIGVLDMQSVHLNDFDRSDVVVMEAVADRVATAIENARLFEETRRRALQLQIIEEVGRRISAILDPGELFPYMAKAIQQNFGYYHVDIFLADRPTGYVVFEASNDPVAEKVWKEQGLRFKIGEDGMISWVAYTGEPLLANDVSQEPRYLPDELLPEVKSELIVPLKVSEQVVGVLDVSSDQFNAFDEDDLFVLQTLANQIAIAVENARLFREIEERRVYLEGVLGNAPDAIVTLDDRFQVVEWNTGAEGLFGYSWEEAIGRHLDDLVTNPDVFEEAVGFTQRVLSGEGLPPTQAVRYRKDGSPVDVIVAGSPIRVGGRLIGVVAVYTDITDRVRMEETLRALALLDDLTGLYNRRGFLALAQQQLKAAYRFQWSMLLLFADFDGLKQINDAFGHTEGDQALIETAGVFRETFRESDIIARIGGDEFVVLAIETDTVNPEIIAARLQDNLEARNAREDRCYKLSLSVGVAHYDPGHPCSIDELLARADRAMYEKKRGNDRG